MKKSRSKEFKTNEFKGSKYKTNPSSIGPTLSANKSKSKSESKCLNSPKVDANKYLKPPKEKHSSRARKRSTSISSDSTPLLSSPPSNSAPNYLNNAEESASPLSSYDESSSFRLKPIRNQDIVNDKFVSADSDSDQSVDRIVKSKDVSKKKPNSRDTSKDKQKDSSTPQTNKRKRDLSKESEKHLDSNVCRNEYSLYSSPNVSDSLLINDLIDMQKKFNESTNTDLLQKVVDIIEESGMFSLTKTTIDFDLIKLDEKTIRRVKSYLI